MKATKIEVSYTLNLGNYESAKIGGEFELEPGEKVTDTICRAFQGLKKTAASAWRRPTELSGYLPLKKSPIRRLP